MGVCFVLILFYFSRPHVLQTETLGLLTCDRMHVCEGEKARAREGQRETERDRGGFFFLMILLLRLCQQEMIGNAAQVNANGTRILITEQGKASVPVPVTSLNLNPISKAYRHIVQTTF